MSVHVHLVEGLNLEMIFCGHKDADDFHTNSCQVEVLVLVQGNLAQRLKVKVHDHSGKPSLEICT